MRVSAKVQFFVGLFVCFVVGCFVFLSANVGFKFGASEKQYYTVSAKFTNINGLKTKSALKVGGITIGYVDRVELDKTDFEPVVYIKIDKKFNDLPDNSVLSIKTNGILGDKFLDLKVGFFDPDLSKYLTDGSVIFNTNSVLDLEDLISKFAFGDKK